MLKQKRKHRYWQRRIKTKLFDQFKDKAAMCAIETSEDINRTINEIEQISKRLINGRLVPALGIMSGTGDVLPVQHCKATSRFFNAN